MESYISLGWTLILLNLFAQNTSLGIYWVKSVMFLKQQMKEGNTGLGKFMH